MTDEMVENEAKEILVNYIAENIKQHSASVDLRFTVKHSLRVEAYCMEIKDSYKSLSNKDILTLKIAAILHDIGNVIQRENHGAIGGKIVAGLFDRTEYISKCGIDKNHLADIISGHSDKEDTSDKDIISIILKDADVLDQIGAMSILMHSNKYDYNSLDFYQNILKEINEKEFSFIGRQLSLLRTEPAKKILEKKLQFIKSFAEELEYEIKGEMGY